MLVLWLAGDSQHKFICTLTHKLFCFIDVVQQKTYSLSKCQLAWFIVNYLLAYC